MNTEKRTALYCRVSTSEQSPQMQIDCLTEFARHRGYKIVQRFVDHGVSGVKDSRPELNKLMDAARKRKIDVVLIYRFDRFARSVRFLVNALHEFDSLGVEFVSYAENVDTSTPLGRCLFQMCSALAELERNLIRERSIEGVRRAVARHGRRPGRPAKQVDKERVLALRAEGKNVSEIARLVGVGRNIVARIVKESEATTLHEITPAPATA
jgi:DNA invertase Pin-like site-specific DNA recombinase